MRARACLPIHHLYTCALMCSYEGNCNTYCTEQPPATPLTLSAFVAKECLDECEPSKPHSFALSEYSYFQPLRYTSRSHLSSWRTEISVCGLQRDIEAVERILSQVRTGSPILRFNAAAGIHTQRPPSTEYQGRWDSSSTRPLGQVA